MVANLSLPFNQTVALRYGPTSFFVLISPLQSERKTTSGPFEEGSYSLNCKQLISSLRQHCSLMSLPIVTRGEAEAADSYLIA